MAIIITGASKGIGKFLFDTYTDKGYRVLGTYNNTGAFSKGNSQYYKVDIANYGSVSKWISDIGSFLDSIVLINCAGISYNSFGHKADIEQWDKVIDVNLKGTFNVIRCILPIMRQQNYGRIISLSSVVSKFPTPGVSAYAASKAGLIGLTKSLAIENASRGITVNTINLGYVNIGMGINDVPPAYQEKMRTRIPNGRFCNPEEIMNTIEYLINTEYINGSAVDINGCLM